MSQPPTQSSGATLPTRKVRVTVPLFDTSVVNADGYMAHGRLEVTPSIVLAELTEQEAERVRDSLVEPLAPRWRLELHDVEVRFDPEQWWYEDPAVAPMVKRLFSLLTLVIRVAPRWPTVVLDERDDSQWRRYQWLNISGGGAPFHSTLPVDRLQTWARLVEEWPTERWENLDLALDFYYESVVDAHAGHPHRSLLLASVALEVLLCADMQGELTHRLAHRGATLTTRGSTGRLTYRRLKRWYGARSRLVHAGHAPTTETVTQVHQFLMRALPSMAALTKATGSFERATDLLHDAAWERSPTLDALFETPDPWWGYVDFATVYGAE